MRPVAVVVRVDGDAGGHEFVDPIEDLGREGDVRGGEVRLELLHYEAFELQADPGFTLSTYTAVPGTASADALRMLGSWATTQDSPSPSTSKI